MQSLRAYWRRFAESVIVFVNKYQNNLYLKTQITFIATLLLIGIVNIISLALITYHVSEETVNIVFNTWGSALVEGVPTPSFTIQELEEKLAGIRFYYLLFIGALNMVGVIVVGVIASRLSLEPIREGISAQKNFIAHTAHELRTPLSVARTNIEATLLQKDEVTKEECLEELQLALVELDGLAGIINNLVMLNTLTNLEPAEYHYHDLRPIIAEVGEAYRTLMETKRITFSIESADELTIWSNRNAVKQMLSNVIGNAINFTPENGKVTVRAHQLSNHYVRVVVTDTGIGIPENELQFIFKPFYRSTLVQDRNDGGSGLGLSIVRELVRLHHGRIGFKSVMGEGTTVTIDLPILRSHSKRATHSDRAFENKNMIVFNFSRWKS